MDESTKHVAIATALYLARAEYRCLQSQPHAAGDEVARKAAFNVAFTFMRRAGMESEFSYHEQEELKSLLYEDD
ncbi:hypothetical protein E7T09_04120 [Deinococcus sp. KSM4-11]|uniref:hypothetical protein n=1 Tax=Deinococcus sp. KSM4-11 TaxID=2568654 RepID=UPI0010A43AC5|nr:hypothetical protein [Deinococcus sp. KSM4-11]THF88400.1 hypothetical protein E7T09_04120 [Deinococcus sp. KSM4-11]